MRKGLVTLVLVSCGGSAAVVAPPDAAPVPDAVVGTTPLPGWDGKLTTYAIASPVPGITSRNITVLVPPGYGDAASADRRYPAMYMHDGQNCLSSDPFGHGGWQVHTVSYDLTTRGLMAPAIIVCVDNNGQNRTAEFNPGVGTAPGPTAEGYLDFVEKTVVPFVEARYRTAAGPAHRGLGGSSYGAIISLYGAWTRPQSFGFVMAMSTAFNAYDFIAVAGATPPPKKPLRIYIDSGTTDYSGGDDDEARTLVLRDVLISKGFVLGVDLEHYIGQGDSHSEDFWRGRLPEALPFLFPLE
jgi:enterochelin esterase-like enzyme